MYNGMLSQGYGEGSNSLPNLRGATESATGGPGQDPERGSNDPKLNNKQADKILRQNGYKVDKQLSSRANRVYYNPKGTPKYMVRSRTSHTGDAFKGYNSARDIKLGRRTGSYDTNLKWISK